MTGRQEEHRWRQMSRTELESELRSLPRPSPAAGLESRLMADIPAIGATGHWPVKRWYVPGTARLVTAAVALLLALATWRYGPSVVERIRPARPDTSPRLAVSTRTEGPQQAPTTAPAAASEA